MNPSPLSPSAPTPLLERWCKLLLVASVALFFTLVAFTNLTDPAVNYQFVRHVLSMDSTFPGNREQWRSIPWPAAHIAFYACIILWETACAILAWWASAALFRARLSSTTAFLRARRIAVAALTAGMLLWMVAFLTVGGEWFLMWQSRLWNGQDAAFRMFTVEGVILILLLLPETAH
jgi:predicted small integral membrane protein